MKTLNLYLFAVIAAFLFIRCEDNSEELQEVFYPTNVDYGNTPLGLSSELNSIAGDGVTNEAVTLYAAKQMPWRFSDLPSWLSFSQQSGMGNSNLTYTADQNPSVTVGRTAYFFLESELGNLPLRRTLSAHQLTRPKSFTVTPDEPSYTFGHEGGTLELNVKSNQKWSISRATGEVAFAKLSHTEDSADAVVTVTIPPYNSLVIRTQSNTFRFVDASSNQVFYEFQVIQTPPAVSTGLVEKTMTFKKEGETQSLSLGAAPSYSVQCDLAWADITPTSGIGEVKLNISTLPNWSTSERSGYAYVYVEGELKTKILLVQAPRQFKLHKSSCKVNASRGSVSFDMLSSDGTWTATTDADWLEVSPVSGEAGEKQTITFAVMPNNSLDNRTATVSFSRIDNVVASVEFEVVQEGCYFNAGEWTDGAKLGPDAQTTSCKVDSNLPWTASTNTSWITLTKDSGSPAEGQELSFSVMANPTQESRVGEIIVSYNEKTIKILVVQESAYINSSSQTVSIPSKGGSHNVTISSNGAWSASTNATWLTLSKTSGSGNVQLNLTARDNASATARTAEIVFTLGANGVQRKLVISQEGRYLKVPVNTVNFFGKGGKQRFTIESDGILAVSSSEEWLKAKIESGNFFLSGNILLLEAEKERAGIERSAVVTVSLSDLTSGELNHTIIVNQSGGWVSTEDWSDGVTIGPDAQDTLCVMDGNTSWTASTNNSWIRLTKSSGSPTEGQELSFSVTPNLTHETRQGEILITYEGGESIIPIVQNEYIFDTGIHRGELSCVSSKGGSFIVPISSNCAWHVECDAEWVTFSKTSGNGSMELELTIDENLHGDWRDATIIFKSNTDDLQWHINIYQKHKPETFVVNGVTFNIIRVNKGSFEMGDNSDEGSFEYPAHQVTLSHDYWIGETEVTQELWMAVMGDNPSYVLGEQLPVTNITKEDCDVFFENLRDLTGVGFSLPTEAEWEYAARGGRYSMGYKFSGGNTLDDVAWCDKNSNGTLQNVKTKTCNELGIYDMSGNVWELCQDFFDFYDTNQMVDPTGPEYGADRVIRGGSFQEDENHSPISVRGAVNDGDPAMGFRLAISLNRKYF